GKANVLKTDFPQISGGFRFPVHIHFRRLFENLKNTLRRPHRPLNGGINLPQSRQRACYKKRLKQKCHEVRKNQLSAQHQVSSKPDHEANPSEKSHYKEGNKYPPK